MTTPTDRMDALSAMVALWPVESALGSGFAADQALSGDLPPFDFTRNLLLTCLRRIRASAKLAQDDDGWSAHLLMLRPALVMASKAAWILRPEEAADRAGRTLGMFESDMRMGAAAMRKAVSQGALPEFENVAAHFDKTRVGAAAGVSVEKIDPPRDELMIQELGTDIDRYYGSSDAKSSLQLLWNTSSCLAHGETWFPFLAGGMQQRRPFGEVLSSQSFDAMCSAFNTTGLRILHLASGRPSEDGLRAPVRDSTDGQAS